MFSKDFEIDIIKSEQLFLDMGDPLPVSPLHDHDLHIMKHQEALDALLKDEESGYRNQRILVLNAHIDLHKAYKKRQSK